MEYSFKVVKLQLFLMPRITISRYAHMLKNIFILTIVRLKDIMSIGKDT
jgi:hypothetical protein